jgi:hypothetical protein
MLLSQYVSGVMGYTAVYKFLMWYVMSFLHSMYEVLKVLISKKKKKYRLSSELHFYELHSYDFFFKRIKFRRSTKFTAETQHTLYLKLLLFMLCYFLFCWVYSEQFTLPWLTFTSLRFTKLSTVFLLGLWCDNLWVLELRFLDFGKLDI